jgi:hypothetical protein
MRACDIIFYSFIEFLNVRSFHICEISKYSEIICAKKILVQAYFNESQS